jgi:phosphoribosylformylglycinamidine synthase
LQAAVITFPGSNCDRDAAVALEAVTGRAPAMIWHRDTELPKLDLVVVPGGFTYGDYLRVGAMAAHSPIMREVVALAKKGAAVFGICNGFQILAETGLLPGTLMRNADRNFVCRDVHLRVESSDSIYTRKYDAGFVARIPVAHGEGNYYADQETLDRLEGEGQVAFRYVDAYGAETKAANPNGSQRNIAGIFDKSRRILGMMPHPERLADEKVGGTDGRVLFESLLEALS